MANPASIAIRTGNNTLVDFEPNLDPAKGAKQDTGNASLASILAKIIAAPATEAKQDTALAATNLVGTRAYGAAVARLAYTGTSGVSGAVAATEVLLHNCGDGRCFIKAGSGTPVATVNDLPIEPGEKFHLRITTGDKIAALQDSVTGNLNIIPVA